MARPGKFKGLTRIMRAGFRSEALVLLPPLLLAWVWFGAEGAVIVAVAGIPSLYLAQRNAHRLPEAEAAIAAPGGHPRRDRAVQALDAALAAAPQSGKATACLVVGLDDPQRMLGTYGQGAVDVAVGKTGERLRGMLRDSDTIVRLEGARFAVALGPMRRTDLETVIQIAGRLQAVAREPLSIDATAVYTSLSVGFCLGSRAPEPTGTALLGAAERALDDAWRNGPGSIRAYSDDIRKATERREEIRDTVEAALENGEFVAFFQPQISTDTGDIAGFEALARWNHPTRGLLPPAEFLPAIMDTGLSERLSEVMLAQALSALRKWDRQGLRVPGVAVNFAREDLRNPNLVAKLKWELDRFDLSADRLTVEILESVVAETDSDIVVRNIAALSQVGCGIDLDDFGTGHASIGSIRRFDVDRIKIDRSFVTRVDSDPAQQQMVSAILSMAERLGLKTLAEGVETVGEHALLCQLGCTHVQGYVIARPMPFEETAEWLARHRAKLAATPRVNRKTG